MIIALSRNYKKEPIVYAKNTQTFIVLTFEKRNLS